MFLESSEKWPTAPDCEILSSPDIQVLFARYASMNWSMASKSTVLQQPWLCRIVEVFIIRAKFLKSSGYYTGINSAIIFRTTNVFWLLPRRYSPCQTLRFSNPRVKQCAKCQQSNYHYIINHRRYLLRLELLRSRDICATKLACTLLHNELAHQVPLYNQLQMGTY